MALPMVHLLVAERWAENHPEYKDNAEFYLGAISPDAIHIRDHDDKSHKNYVHLDNWTVLHPEKVIAYWQKYHAPFDIGYGLHVLTDALWVRARIELLPELNAPNGGLNKELYYRDTFLTDFALYREGGRALFRIMEKGEAPCDHPLLTHDEFVQWQRDVMAMYEGPCPKRGNAEYITPAYARTFVETCQKELNSIYGRFERMNEVLNAIHARRSTRGFNDVQLTEDELQALVDAALAAPSARNTQMWHFSVVQNKELLRAFSREAAELMNQNQPVGSRGRFDEKGYDLFYHAPTVIFISRPKACANEFVDIDCGIACENIALAAQSLGLGSVIVGCARMLFHTERGAYYNRAFEFPEGYEFSVAIVVGHNTVTKEAHPIGENKVSYIR